MALTRHSRQTRLVEIGDDGQEKLAAAELVVHSGEVSGDVEARYLAGAGVGALIVQEAAAAAAARAVDANVRVQVAHAAPPPEALSAGLPATGESTPGWVRELDPAAREVAVGAYRALVAVRTVVFGGHL